MRGQAQMFTLAILSFVLLLTLYQWSNWFGLFENRVRFYHYIEDNVLNVSMDIDCKPGGGTPFCTSFSVVTTIDDQYLIAKQNTRACALWNQIVRHFNLALVNLDELGLSTGYHQVCTYFVADDGYADISSYYTFCNERKQYVRSDGEVLNGIYHKLLDAGCTCEGTGFNGLSCPTMPIQFESPKWWGTKLYAENPLYTEPKGIKYCTTFYYEAPSPPSNETGGAPPSGGEIQIGGMVIIIAAIAIVLFLARKKGESKS